MVEITGTLEAQDGSYTHLNSQGETYEQAKAVLEAMVPEGHKLTFIRTF